MDEDLDKLYYQVALIINEELKDEQKISQSTYQKTEEELTKELVK